MSHARAAVQAQNGYPRAVRAYDLVPDASARHLDMPLGRNWLGRECRFRFAHRLAYTSVAREIDASRLRLLHHSAQKMPITAHASENHTMLLPVLNGCEISLTKNPLYRM